MVVSSPWANRFSAGVKCGEICEPLNIPGRGQSGFGRSLDVGILPGLKYSSTWLRKMDGSWASVQLWERPSCRRCARALALRSAVSVKPSGGEETEGMDDCWTTSMMLSVYCATMMSAIDALMLDSRTLPLVAPSWSHNNKFGLKDGWDDMQWTSAAYFHRV